MKQIIYNCYNFNGQQKITMEEYEDYVAGVMFIVATCACYFMLEFLNDTMQRKSCKSSQNVPRPKSCNQSQNGKTLTSIADDMPNPNNNQHGSGSNHNQNKKNNLKNNKHNTNLSKKSNKKNNKQNNNYNNTNNNNNNNNSNNVNNSNNDHNVNINNSKAANNYNNNNNNQHSNNNQQQHNGKQQRKSNNHHANSKQNKRQAIDPVDKHHYKPKTICCTQRETNNQNNASSNKEGEKTKQQQTVRIIPEAFLNENVTEYKKSNVSHEDFLGPSTSISAKSIKKIKKTQRCELKRKQIEESPIKVEPTIKNLELMMMDVDEDNITNSEENHQSIHQSNDEHDSYHSHNSHHHNLQYDIAAQEDYMTAAYSTMNNIINSQKMYNIRNSERTMGYGHYYGGWRGKGAMYFNPNINSGMITTPTMYSTYHHYRPLDTSNGANSSYHHSSHITKRTMHFRKLAQAFVVKPERGLKLMDISEAELFFHLQRYLVDRNLLRVYGFPIESAVHKGCIEIFKCLPKRSTAKRQQITKKDNKNFKNNCIINTTNTINIATIIATVAAAAVDITQNTAVINENDGLDTNEVVEVVSTVKLDNRNTDDTTTDNGDADELNSNSDSGQGSGVSSPALIESDISEAGEDEPISTTAFYTPDGTYQIFSQYDQKLEKQCVRCNRAFLVNAAGEYLSFEPCQFHWGRLYQVFGGDYGFGSIYTCCNNDEDTEGCSHSKLHVWTGAVIGLNGPYSDFVYTRPRWNYELGPKVYALDCEMSFTGLGLELTKITLISYNGHVVYESFVRPELDIIDYNTRFSGITEEHMSSPNVKSLTEVQQDLLSIIDEETILVGHGLDNDLRVLRIVHKNVVDTSIVFPHASGFPYRRSLKHLTKLYLCRDIQNSDLGHDSLEDSRACLELIMWRLQNDINFNGTETNQS